MLPPLNALRTFEAVVRLGSFRAAAEALFVTQSAVSHQIRNVEEALGQQLFMREGNRTKLLPLGKELAHRLSISFAEIEVACEQVRGSHRTLVIAAIPSVAMCWLIPRLSRFRMAYPDIEIRIIYAMHGRDISFHDAHLAFVFADAPAKSPTVEGQFFLSGQSVPVCSPARLNRLGQLPKTAIDYLRLGLLHDDSELGWKTWLRGLENSDTAIANADTFEGTTFEDFTLLRVAALSGQGVALCPPSMVQPDLDSGALVQLSERALQEGYDYYLLTSTSAAPQVLQQALVFREWAIAERDIPLNTQAA